MFHWKTFAMCTGEDRNDKTTLSFTDIMFHCSTVYLPTQHCTWGNVCRVSGWTGLWSSPPLSPVFHDDHHQKCREGRCLWRRKSWQEQAVLLLNTIIMTPMSWKDCLLVITAVWFSPQAICLMLLLQKCSSGFGKSTWNRNVPWPSWPYWPLPNVYTLSSAKQTRWNRLLWLTAVMENN